jgi:hypothetical protein
VAAEEISDRLYGLPLEEFTRSRDAAARELRKEGRREEAEQVKALRKPTAAAAAVNQLVRTHRAQVEAFLRAAATLRDAQVAGKGDLAAAARAERAALDKLVALGGDAVRATLQAAAVDDRAARDLLEARLQREPEPRGFGTLLAHAKPATSKPAAAKPAAGKPAVAKPVAIKPSAARPAPAKRSAPTPSRPDDSAARARLREAKTMQAAAASEERQTRRHWQQSQRELEKAQAAVEKAQRELDRLHGH